MRVASAADGLLLDLDGHMLTVPPFALAAGELAVFAPNQAHEGLDLAATLARTLTTLRPAARGTFTLLDHDVATLEYAELLETRRRLALVPGRGGLLSNRTVAENIALPLSVHAGVSHDQEVAQVDHQLAAFDLGQVRALRPHVLDASTRFRALVARALVLDPAWLVIEGRGDFEPGPTVATAWQRVFDWHAAGTGALAVCLGRPSLDFETWLAARGARIYRYSLAAIATAGSQLP